MVDLVAHKVKNSYSGLLRRLLRDDLGVNSDARVYWEIVVLNICN